ncbi:MAG: Fe-S cluster assembly protein SufD [Acidobacteriota bacterium]|jgi:Fe-S cluster assembly protein SufD
MAVLESATVEHHLGRYTARREGLSGEPGFLRELREAGMEAFRSRGFPSRRDEEWRATPVRGLAELPFRTLDRDGDGLSPATLEAAGLGLPGALVVLVNGRFHPELSRGLDVDGVEIGSLAERVRQDPATVEAHLGRHADASRNPFVALNQALWADGAFIRVAAGAEVPVPVQILHLVKDPGEVGVSDPRTLVLVEEGARLRLVEGYAGPAGAVYWTNPVTEIVVGSGAEVRHHKVQREGDAAFHVATIQAQVGHAGVFSSHSISLGGRLVRNDLRVVLGAEGGDCTLDGLYLLSGSQHEDNHTFIDHARPHCASRELYKGILDGESRGVFHGTVLVRADAQKTDAHQANRNLLLSDDALVDTQPNLEIFADDVKCAHGATVGQLEEAELFYLRSRGLDPAEARRLLIHAFAAEILRRLPLEPLREALESELATRLHRFAGEEGR